MTKAFHKFHGTLEAACTAKLDEHGRWWVKIKLDDNSLQAYKDSGIQAKLQADNSVYLRRPGKITLKTGETTTMEPIKFYGPDKVPMDGNKVGWGSKIVLGVTVYDTKKGPGHRIEFMGVKELVPYEPMEDMW